MKTALATSITALLSLACVCCMAADGPFLADRHGARGLKCDACHDPAAPTTVKLDEKRHQACAGCHGFYDEVVKKTVPKDPDEQNPHGQHDGNLPCTTCHKGHQQGVNYCGKCHMWSFKVP